MSELVLMIIVILGLGLFPVYFSWIVEKLYEVSTNSASGYGDYLDNSEQRDEVLGYGTYKKIW